MTVFIGLESEVGVAEGESWAWSFGLLSSDDDDEEEEDEEEFDFLGLEGGSVGAFVLAGAGSTGWFVPGVGGGGGLGEEAGDGLGSDDGGGGGGGGGGDEDDVVEVKDDEAGVAGFGLSEESAIGRSGIGSKSDMTGSNDTIQVEEVLEMESIDFLQVIQR
ncbi:hypothetical protein DFQ29_001215 [Apophysomyces sp. BC1021]|nr:hypothetical protein DFQ29_001215 [Apophysomyces sp. BC1021]